MYRSTNPVNPTAGVPTIARPPIVQRPGVVVPVPTFARPPIVQPPIVQPPIVQPPIVQRPQGVVPVLQPVILPRQPIIPPIMAQPPMGGLRMAPGSIYPMSATVNQYYQGQVSPRRTPEPLAQREKPVDTSLQAFRAWKASRPQLFNLGLNIGARLTVPFFSLNTGGVATSIRNAGTLNGIYKLYRQGKQTDLPIRIKGSMINVHRLVLTAASSYFDTLLSGRFSDNTQVVDVTDTDSETFLRYIDFIYGQPLEVGNWRDAFNLFYYIKYTATEWPNQDNDVVKGVSVPATEYIEYMEQLAQLYDGEVPNEVIKASMRFITEPIDLSPLNEEVIRLILNSSKLENSDARQELLEYMYFSGADNALIRRLSRK